MSRCTICVNLPVPCIQSHAGRVIDDNRAPAGAQEHLLRCPFCAWTWPTTYGPAVFASCPSCRGSFSFNPPRRVPQTSHPQPDRAALVERLRDFKHLAVWDSNGSHTLRWPDGDLYMGPFERAEPANFALAALQELAARVLDALSAPAEATERPAPGTRQEEDRQRRVGPGTDAPDRLGIGEAEATPLRSRGSETMTNTLRESPYREIEHRRALENAKAFAKYGAQGLAPRGDESRDVLDYAINETVGLLRYAEMIEARFATPRGRRLAKSLKACAELVSVDLILFRQALLDEGVELGEPEHGGEID